MTQRSYPAALVFSVLAATYFVASLVRTSMATLSPHLAREFSLGAAQLGLLGASFFIAFSAVQLPMGRWLDRYGPRRVELAFLAIALMALLAFAFAHSYAQLVLARAACGIGFAACLMGPLTGFRRWYDRATQLRLASWMLVASALGAMASTLPVQWAVSAAGWRTPFLVLAAVLLVAMFAIRRVVPPWQPHAEADGAQAPDESYGGIRRHAYFRRMMPIGFIGFGGLPALLTLWAGPWLVTVAHCTPAQASAGLLVLNFVLLLAYAGWGAVAPRLAQRDIDADRLMRWAFPACLPPLAALALWPGAPAAASVALLAWHAAACSVLTLSTPAMAMRFPASSAGRALAAYNLVVFLGVAAIQWAFGAVIDLLRAAGWQDGTAFRGALALLATAQLIAWTRMAITKSERNKQALSCAAR